MARPAVSVVMTVHDGAAHLERAVDSVRRQHLDAWELIVVDDASTDETPALLERLARAEGRLVVERLSLNVGPAAAANVGLGLARADVLARLDADDEAHADRLARQLALLDARADVDVVGSACRVIDERGALLWTQPVPLGPVAIALRSAVGPPLVHSSVAWRRAAQLRYEPTARVGQDAELWARVAPGLRCENVGDALVDYRVWHGGVTARHGDAQRQTHDAASAVALAALLGAAPAPDAVRAFRAWVRRADPAARPDGAAAELVERLVSWARRHGLEDHAARRVLSAPVTALGQPGHAPSR